MPGPSEHEIEKTLLISIQLGMIDIIDKINTTSKDYKLIIAGGRGIEFYLSGLLQNNLEDKNIYDKSFDYDMYVYPMNDDKTYFYHPSYLFYEGYKYDEKTTTFVKGGERINPYHWLPYHTLLLTIREYYAEHTPGSMYHRDDILSALKFLNLSHNVINIDLFEHNLKNGSAFFNEMLILHDIVVWRVKIRVPLIDGGKQEIELIDLKNSLRYAQKNGFNNLILYDKNGNTNSEGRYIKMNDKMQQLHLRGGFWEYNNKSDFHSTCILAYPSIGGRYGKEIYIPRVSILLRDNSLLIGNEDDGQYILGLETYLELFKKISDVLGISYIDRNKINFPFTMDPDYKRISKHNSKYTSKYKKRFIRVFCLAYLFNHLFEPNENIFPHWNIQSMSLDKSVTFFSAQIISNSGTRFIMETHNKPYLLINNNRFPFAYDIFNNGHVPAYLSSPSLNEAGAKIIIPSNPLWGATNVSDWNRVKDIHDISRRNLLRRKNKQLGNLTQNFSGHQVSYFEVSKKWSLSAWKSTNFPKQFADSFDVQLNILMKLSGINKHNFRNNFYKCLGSKTDRLDIDLYMFSCLYFSYNYPPDSFDQGTFTCYRWGLPLSVLLETASENLTPNKIENLRTGSEIYITRFLSTTMNTFIDLKSPILWLPNVRNVISKGYTLYIFKLKNKGFLYMNEMSFYEEEHEILIPAFTKFKIISRQWKIVPIFASFNKEEIKNYKQMYCITLEQIEEDYSVFTIETPMTMQGVKILPTGKGWGQDFSHILGGGSLYGGGGGGGGGGGIPVIIAPPVRVKFLSHLNEYYIFIKNTQNQGKTYLNFELMIRIFIEDLEKIKSAENHKIKMSPLKSNEIQHIDALKNFLEILHESYINSKILYDDNTKIKNGVLYEVNIVLYKKNKDKLDKYIPVLEEMEKIYQ
jgi:hypothetical protein